MRRKEHLTRVTTIIDYDICWIWAKNDHDFPTFILQKGDKIFSLTKFTKTVIEHINTVTDTMISNSKY